MKNLLPGGAIKECAETRQVEKPEQYAHWALLSLSFTIFISALSTSIPNVGLPALMEAFDATFQQIQWVVLSYLLAITALITSIGRIGDILGHKILLQVGIAVFTAGSILCGLAPTLWVLLAARAVQGIGAAAMMAFAMALVGKTVPKLKIGRAMGALGTASAVGTALGPTLGGVLIAKGYWPAIFFINGPLGILAFILVHRFLPIDLCRRSNAHLQFDYTGALTLTFALTTYALSVTLQQGFPGTLNLVLILAASVGFAVFVNIEKKAASPLISPRIFSSPIVSTGFAMSMIVTTVIMSTLIVGPFYLSNALGMDASRVGAVMSSGPIAAALTGIPAGRAVDRLGCKAMTIAGLIALTAGCLMLAMLPVDFGIGGYITSLVVVTIGYAVFQAANNTAVMAQTPPLERGVLSALLNMSRYLGLVTGASLMGTVFATGVGESDIINADPAAIANGVHLTFTVAFLLGLVSLAIAMAMARRTPKQYL